MPPMPRVAFGEGDHTLTARAGSGEGNHSPFAACCKAGGRLCPQCTTVHSGREITP